MYVGAKQIGLGPIVRADACTPAMVLSLKIGVIGKVDESKCLVKSVNPLTPNGDKIGILLQTFTNRVPIICPCRKGMTKRGRSPGDDSVG
jgi:hypothetical protein